MKFIDWFRPGIRVKRWILLGLLGVLTIALGLSYLNWNVHLSFFYIVFSVTLIVAGIYFIYLAFACGLGTLFNAIRVGFNISLDSEKLTSLLLEKRILVKGPKVVVIGGGHGLSTMLRGLKLYSSNLTAIVAVADNGGGSGVLRQDLGILPPGDIRNCILALADTEPIMEKLMQYRFDEGSLKGQSFGNLFLAAMNGISNGFEDAVKKMSDVLAVTGRVLPATLTSVNLCAENAEGLIIRGESEIREKSKEIKVPIKRAFLEPENVKPLNEALEAIKEADMIILGPGSLYTSVIPNLLVKGIPEAIEKSKAIKVYVCNIMTEPGETEDYTVSEHLRVMFNHSKQGIVDYCIVNSQKVPEDILQLYKEDGSDQVTVDNDEILQLGVQTIEKDLMKINDNFVRHDPQKLAEAIMKIVTEKVLSKDKKRIIDYYYIKDRLKRL